MRLSNIIIEISNSAIAVASNNDTPELITKGNELVDRKAFSVSALQSDQNRDNNGNPTNPIINLIAGDVTFTALDVLQQSISSSGAAVGTSINFGTVVVAAGVNEG